MLSVIQEAYVGGMSTRRVDDLVRALSIEGISKSEVSRICAALDAEVRAFRSRPLGELAYPPPLARRHVSQGPRGRTGRVAGGARRGRRGLDRRAPDPRSRALGRQRRGLGLAGLHPGPRRARPARGPARHQRRPRGAGQGRPGAAPRLGLAAVSRPLHPQCPGPRAPQRAELVASAIRAVFEQPDATAARDQLDRVIDTMAGPYPRVAELLADVEADLWATSRSRPTATTSPPRTRRRRRSSRSSPAPRPSPPARTTRSVTSTWCG